MTGTAALFALTLFAQGTPVADYWSPLTTIRTVNREGLTRYGAPAHATLLPNGDIMMVGVAHAAPSGGVDGDLGFVGIFTPTNAWAPLPTEVFVPWQTVPLEAYMATIDDQPGDQRYFVHDQLFCSGQTLLADGTFFTAGGTRLFVDNQPAPPGVARFFLLGMNYAVTYGGGAWNQVVARMVGAGILEQPGVRWYPTATRLSDGKVLVVSGDDLVMAKDGYDQYVAYMWPNLSAETYDPVAQSWNVLSTNAASPPEIWNPDYTHVFQLPKAAETGGFDVLMFGQAGLPVLMSPYGPTRWQVRSNKPRPQTLPGENPNFSAASALLPMRWPDGEWGYSNGATMVTGGDHGSSHEHAFDVYDPMTDAWMARREMTVHRHLPMTVGLPDGRMLVAGGVSCGCSGSTVTRAQYIDPAGGAFALTQGWSEMPETRGYHGVSLLLPDGRVFVGGGRTHGHEEPADEQPTFRYLYPGYMFDPSRPIIGYAPQTVSFGAGFWVTWTGRPLAEAVLVGLGSMTHAFDGNQRSIELPLAYQSNGAAYLVAPANGQEAPPGWYMLFLIDDQRSPSPAAMVRVQ